MPRVNLRESQAKEEILFAHLLHEMFNCTVEEVGHMVSVIPLRLGQPDSFYQPPALGIQRKRILIELLQDFFGIGLNDFCDLARDLETTLAHLVHQLNMGSERYVGEVAVLKLQTSIFIEYHAGASKSRASNELNMPKGDTETPSASLSCVMNCCMEQGASGRATSRALSAPAGRLFSVAASCDVSSLNIAG